MIIIVIGAGIVGLHVACALQKKGSEVYVLEKESYLAEHTSGRNSGVIHSGIFYPPGSFREHLCIEGNRKTYEWLQKLDVPYRACGKWVVPEEGQEEELEPFFEKVKKLPIPQPKLLASDEIAAKEPSLRRTKGIFIPSTGILDAASYVKAMANYAENRGIQVILNCQIHGLKNESTLETNRGEISFDLCINTAGLQCDQIAQMAGIPDFEIRPCRGDYYLLNKQPISRPVYHLPYKGAQGLGIHLTPTLDGQLLLGPNAFFIDEKEDYQHQTDIQAYEEALSFYLPGFKNYSLTPAYSGNRPKLFVKGVPHPEFLIHKHQNWIHLLGIESPGLTSAPVIGNYVANLI